VTRPRLALAVAVLVVSAFLAACGSSSGDAGSGTDPRGLPDVTVTDVASGEAVTLASVTTPDRPTLVWFWAPF
jgi:hypothetical protein